MTPSFPEKEVQRLPPKLRKISLRAIPGYSKAREGLNLRVKEIRNLRDIIVTAAVHQGFSRQLRRN